MMTHQFEKYLQLGEKTYFNRLGKVVKIVGLTIESVGPDAKLNDLCRIVIDREKDHAVMAEAGHDVRTICPLSGSSPGPTSADLGPSSPRLHRRTC